MTRLGLANLAAMVLALAVAGATAGRASTDASPSAAAGAAPSNTMFPLRTLPGGERALVDARGRAVPLRNYRRIVSGSSLVDQLLVALSERDRIVAITGYGKTVSVPRNVGEGLADYPGLANLESTVSLKPDLIVTNQIGNPVQLERLEEHGITVFDLGEMRGVETLLPSIRAVATLLGSPGAGDTLATRFARRLGSVSRGQSGGGRCLYVAVYGGQMSGGAPGSSYHDVIVAAGLSDAAEGKYHEWPTYSVEDVLVLDPDFIFTTEGMDETFCRQAGLDRLRVCRDRRRIFMLEADLIGDPGLRMLEAAEALRDRFEAFEARR